MNFSKLEQKLRIYLRKNPDSRYKLALFIVLLIFLIFMYGIVITAIDRSYLLMSLILLLFFLVAFLLFLISTLFPKIFISVEGIHDKIFLKTIASVLHAYGENLPNLEQLEEDGDIIFLLLGGSNATHWIGRLNILNRPVFCILDRDTENLLEVSKNQHKINEYNKIRRHKAVLTSKREIENYIHPKAIKAVRSIVDIEFGDFDDVPQMIQGINGQRQNTIKEWLNSQAVAKMTPELLDEIDLNGDVRSWLNEIAQLLEK